MKKLLLSVALVASAVAFAEDEIAANAQTIGCLAISSTEKTVIICVPWVKSGYTEQDIAVADIIKTANLTVGDEVKVWNTTAKLFNVWKLTEGEGNVRYWKASGTVSGKGVTPGSGADVTTLKRGDALILTRQDTSTPIYVYGQVPTTAAPTVTIAAGSAGAPAYTLLAPPSTSDYNLNSATWTGLSSGGVNGDRIYISKDGNSLGAAFVYWKKGSGWGSFRNTGWSTDGAVLPAGTGCWYVHTGKNGTVTVTW